MDAMTAIEYRQASSASYRERARCLNEAYVDYLVPLQVNADQLARMDRLYDVSTDASIVAVARERLVGMALLSERSGRGWISAVGTVPEYRRRGIARQMLQLLLHNARRLKMGELTLEVISDNHAAAALYAQLGFVAVRELLTWRRGSEDDPLPVPDEMLSEVNPASLLRDFDTLHKERPSWQREAATLQQLAGQARGYTLALDGRRAAHCLVAERTDGVAILDVGIHPDFGAIRAGRPLLQALSRLYPGFPLSIVNVSADDPLCRVLAALQFRVTIRQHEMLKLA